MSLRRSKVGNGNTVLPSSGVGIKPRRPLHESSASTCGTSPNIILSFVYDYRDLISWLRDQICSMS